MTGAAELRTMDGGSVRVDSTSLDAVVVHGRAEYEALHAAGAGRRAVEDRLAELVRDAGPDGAWTQQARCRACRADVTLHGSWAHAFDHRPNYRETLVCARCGLNARQRMMADLLLRLEPAMTPGAPLYLYEQTTPLYAWACTSLHGRRVIGSEFLGLDVPGGTVIDGVRHEDALALTFGDASLGGIVSADVYEHVPDVLPALREAHRVLAPGGRLLFTVPFYVDQDDTVRRAVLQPDGTIQHLLPPELHGNPVGDGGSLAFVHFGWDLLDRLRDAGFADPHALVSWDAATGCIGGDGQLLVFTAHRD